MATNKDKPVILSANLFPVVGIGASAGGLAAFKKLLMAIPENSGMAYVLVQHLDPNHESLLPEILQKVTAIPVLEISDDIRVAPNHIYVIPSNKMMVATDGVLLLTPRPEKSKPDRNLPIDLFFTSLAEVHQTRAIGVVLSGTASDGTLGLKSIKDHGGITFAQDEASAEYTGMPRSAAQAGVVDFILPPEAIPQKLLEITSKTGISDEALQNIPQPEENVFRQILSLLRIRKGVDFTYYKQTTIRRRILRRVVLNKTEDPAAYLNFLREHTAEQDQLFQDLLIPVTSFFRDTHSFDILCEHVFPAIIKNKTPREVLRIWVAGCSTGQEVYSIAVCFKEFLGQHHEKLQIFGTDLSEPAIAKARSGTYEKGELEGVSPQRLQTYFTKNAGGYQVNQEIRDLCVFAHHNFLKDLPFGKMDFISCRNVLIYMDPYLQKKALTTFHYALNPKGFLLLGKSETAASSINLFTAFGKTDKLFNRKDVPGRFIQVASERSEQILNQDTDTPKRDSMRTDFQKMADEILLTQFTPAGVVVNENMDIVHFRGGTSHYLEQSAGKPTHNLLQLAKHGLAFELRNVLHKAKIEKVSALKENIPVEVNGQLRSIAVQAIPLLGTVEPHYLVLFHDNLFEGNVKTGPEEPNTRKKTSGKLKKDDNDVRIKLLEHELAQAREDMRSITQDQEAFNEELQSANEELLSGSEEMQSLNEELESSKEELQSTNEELTVLNHELIGLNEQVTAARNYSESIVATVAQPLLVLDKKLRVKTANRAFYKTFRLHETGTENVPIYELENHQWNIPRLRELLEDVLPQKTVITGFEVTHEFAAIGERTVLLGALEIPRENKEEKLILLSIDDITDRRKAEAIIAKAGDRFRILVKALPVSVYACDAKGYITFYNDAALKLWGREPEIGKDYWHSFYNMFNTDGSVLPYDISPVAQTLRDGRDVISKVIIVERLNGSRSFIKETTQPELSLSGEITGVINMITDVTEEVEAQKKVEQSESHFRSMADLMPAKISNASVNGDVTYFNKHWLDFTGMSFKELRDFGYHKIMHPDELEEFAQGLQRAGATQTNLVMEMRFMNKKGDYIWHLNIASPVKDENGNQIMWVGVTTDITEQIKTRNSNLQTYKIHSKELEEKVQQRTAELSESNELLQQKNEELGKMNKELEAFTYISSHDLQEPLRKIQTFAGILLQKETQHLSDKGKDYFQRMQDAAGRMQQLILDLLSFSKINSTDRKFEKINLDIIIDKLKTYFKEEIQEKNATIEVLGICELDIIPFQFEQLFQNLISNALKFSRPGVAPHITIHGKIVPGGETGNKKLSSKKDYCHISFTDNGIGFDPKYKEQIFEVFQRLHGREEYPGTGIGLAIVKKIAENHNGIITAESEPGNWARFDIYIPV